MSVVQRQYLTHVTQNKAGHDSQILFDLNARFEIVQFVPQEVGGMLCMVAKVSRLSTEEMRFDGQLPASGVAFYDSASFAE